MRRNGHLYWTSNANFFATVKGKNRTLSVSVSPVDGGWLAVAVEGAKSATIDEVFNDHAHKNLGTFSDAVDAFAAAESFALQWSKQKKNHVTLSNCDCTEVKA